MITARKVAERLCEPQPRDDDTEIHRGSYPIGDGYEFTAGLGGFERDRPLRLMPDGGSWPYVLMLAGDEEKATVYYVEGDITVTFYPTEEAYQAALEEFEKSQDPDHARPML